MREFLDVLAALCSGTLEAIAVLLGVKKSAAIIAFLSAVISLRFVPEMVGWRQKLWMVLGGFFCAVYVAPGLAEYFGFKEKTEYALVFGIGLLGLSVAAAISKIIVSGEWWLLVKEKFLTRKTITNPLDNAAAEEK